MSDFLEEIKSQPDALKDTFNYILNEGKPQFLKIRDFIKRGGITKLIFTGMGSSYIGSYLPYYVLNPHGIAVEMREAGEFLINTFPEANQDCFKDTGIVVISQSGESGEIREIIRKINEIEDTPLTIGITNNPDSYLFYRTELQILMNFDEEVSVTSKSYVCTLLILYVMAKTIISDFFNNKKEIEKINNLIEAMRSLLESKEKINNIWKNVLSAFGPDFSFIEILSDGTSMTTAHQAALNFKEIAKSYSEANSISFFRHGGIEILNDNTQLIIITSDQKNSEFNTQFMRKVVNDWTCGKILHITNQKMDKKSIELQKNPKIIFYQHEITDPFLAPIFEIVILQLLFYRIAEKKGVKPGIFNYSQKVTNDFK
jgi:glucosamine 6-phosphate synthetase-like amidotransferase/phosphosugar isomerase protein